jgi:hypothetical protein
MLRPSSRRLLRKLLRMRSVFTLPQHLPKLQKFVGMSVTPRIEGHLIFKNSVPMQFAWEQMKTRTGLHVSGSIAYNYDTTNLIGGDGLLGLKQECQIRA